MIASYSTMISYRWYALLVFYIVLVTFVPYTRGFKFGLISRMILCILPRNVSRTHIAICVFLQDFLSAITLVINPSPEPVKLFNKAVKMANLVLPNKKNAKCSR